MLGLSVSEDQLLSIVANDGTAVMAESYEAQPQEWRPLVEVVPNIAATHPYQGDKFDLIAGNGRPHIIEHGQDIPTDTMKEDYGRQGKILKFARSFVITSELMAARRQRLAGAGDLVVFGDIVSEIVAGWGESYAQEEEDYLAGMLQKGTLTAGSTYYFRNAYRNNPATDGVPYDGVPWFDTAHPRSSFDTSNTWSNHQPPSGSTYDISRSNIQTMVTGMESTAALNARGDRIRVRPTHLIVPPALEFDAAAILNSTETPEDANTSINPLRRKNLQLLSWRALTDAASSAAYWMVQAGKGWRVIDSGEPEVAIEINRSNDTIVITSRKYFGSYITNARFHACYNKAAS